VAKKIYSISILTFFLLKIKGKIVEACHVSVTRITAQKGTQLLNIYKKIVYYVKSLFGAKICVADIQQA
jgi:hypothetical protein